MNKTPPPGSRPVRGYPGYYVTADGRVWSDRSGRYLTGYWRGPGQGYLTVTLRRHGRNKLVFVHALVATAFHGPRPPNAVVNHRDGDRANNRFTNLEWLSPRQNAQHARSLGRIRCGERHPSAVLLRVQVEVAVELHREGLSLREIAAIWGVHHETVRRIVIGLAWRHLRRME